jgi:hypothetical protein
MAEQEVISETVGRLGSDVVSDTVYQWRECWADRHDDIKTNQHDVLLAYMSGTHTAGNLAQVTVSYPGLHRPANLSPNLADPLPLLLPAACLHRPTMMAAEQKIEALPKSEYL